MKQVELTLYEIFGYLLPGAVFSGGIAVLFWAVFFPQPVVDFDLKTPEVWITFLVVAYVVGHVVQGIGNWVQKWFTRTEEWVTTPESKFPKELMDQCREKVKEWTKADATEMSGEWLYRICDEAVVRSGKLGDRDLYIYREGFYRGTFVGLLFLAVGMVAMIVRLSAEGGTARLGSMEFTRWRLAFLTVVVGVAARLLWKRYWRFAQYRVTQALISSLLLGIKHEKDGKETKEDGAAGK